MWVPSGTKVSPFDSDENRAQFRHPASVSSLMAAMDGVVYRARRKMREVGVYNNSKLYYMDLYGVKLGAIVPTPVSFELLSWKPLDKPEPATLKRRKRK